MKTLSVFFTFFLSFASAENLEKIIVSVPGPHSFASLPIDLILKIGADREQGVQVRILYAGSGPLALENLVHANAEFAVTGAPAAMSLHNHGEDVVLIAAMTKIVPFALVVRGDLRNQIQTVADLKGRSIGANSSTSNSKSVALQLLELILAAEGITPNMVHILPTNQSWKTQLSSISSAEVDAIMSVEPFADRLVTEGRAFSLVDLKDPKTTQKILGAGFLYASLVTRKELFTKSPERVAKMVKILKSSLAWISTHTPEQIVSMLGISNPEEASSLLASLKNHPDAFVQDGSFSAVQIQETNIFFHASHGVKLSESPLRLENMIDDRWLNSSLNQKPIDTYLSIAKLL